MKKFSTLLFSLASAALLFGSCDEVKENERYIEMPMVEAQRTVLIEDFTGQKCINCPTAHDVIHGIIEQYGEEVIAAVAIHPGGNALVYNYTEKLGNNGLGNDMAAQVAAISGIDAVSSLPQGNINRSGLVEYPTWAANVRSALEIPASLTVEGAAAGDVSDETHRTVSLRVTPAEDFSGRINVWIVEDNIVGRQRMQDGSNNREYVHNHVFRTSITPVDGEAVTMQRAIIFEKTYNLEFDPLWVVDNCKAVVFFTGADGKVEQAHSIPLTLSTEEETEK